VHGQRRADPGGKLGFFAVAALFLHALELLEHLLHFRVVGLEQC